MTTEASKPHSSVQALKDRLYAALRHEKSCTCGECSGGLNAVDDLVEQNEALLALLRRIYENERVWRVIPNSIAADLVAEVEGSNPASSPSVLDSSIDIEGAEAGWDGAPPEYDQAASHPASNQESSPDA